MDFVEADLPVPCARDNDEVRPTFLWLGGSKSCKESIMADQQGTGKHPHKSAAEPHEHHEAPTTKGTRQSGSNDSHTTSGSHESTSHSTSESSSDGQGTGKHPHKKASDPHEHHEGAKASK